MSERFRKIEMIRKREIEEKRSEKMENGETENQSWLWKAWRAGEESDPKNKNTEIQTQKPTILEFERDTKEKMSKAWAKKGPAEGVVCSTTDCGGGVVCSATTCVGDEESSAKIIGGGEVIC